MGYRWDIGGGGGYRQDIGPISSWYRTDISYISEDIASKIAHFLVLLNPMYFQINVFNYQQIATTSLNVAYCLLDPLVYPCHHAPPPSSHIKYPFPNHPSVICKGMVTFCLKEGSTRQFQSICNQQEAQHKSVTWSITLNMTAFTFFPSGLSIIQ